MQAGRAVWRDTVGIPRRIESARCRLQYRSLDVEALLPALRAIRALAEARTTNKLEVRTLSRDGVPTVERFDGQLPYDPACVFHLEMMVSLASRGKQHIAETW